MQLAFVELDVARAAHHAIREFADALQASGVRCTGLVEAPAGPDVLAHPCERALRILPDGPLLGLSQPLGRGARGCRLDPIALESCAVSVARTLKQGADILLLNKFGKQEAVGRGFRPLIAEALALSIPVLLGVDARNRSAFEDFAGGLACELPPKADTLTDWWLAASADCRSQVEPAAPTLVQLD